MQQQRQPNDHDSSARGTFSWLLERCHGPMNRSKAGPQRRNLRILAPRVDSPPGWESTQTVQGRCAGSVGNLLAPGFPAVWALCPSDIAIRSASPDVCLFLVSPCACLAAIGPWSWWCSSACCSRASRKRAPMSGAVPAYEASSWDRVLAGVALMFGSFFDARFKSLPPRPHSRPPSRCPPTARGCALLTFSPVLLQLWWLAGCFARLLRVARGAENNACHQT